MPHLRTDGRRSDRRAFRPSLEGDRLESRALMTRLAGNGVSTQTAFGGLASVVTDPQGEQFYVSVVNGGTVRASPAPGGRVSLVVDGSNSQSMLEINQIQPQHSSKSGAHSFRGQLSQQTGILKIASIAVTSGSIGAIEGYHDANLYGPIVVAGANPVNRIAFNAIEPGASIGVGGDLNTLDVLSDARFSGSTGLFVGRDLHWFETGGDLSFQNGANFNVIRNLGSVFQPAKGSGNAGQGLFVGGSLTVGPNDAFSIGRFNSFGVLVNGDLNGFSRITIDTLPLVTYIQEVSNNFGVRGAARP